VRTDDATGHKEIHYFGTQSFIKSLGRPGRRVLRICNPKTGQVLFGPPIPRAG
jgi:hypothetical protein